MQPPAPFPGLGDLGSAPDPRLASTEQTISSERLSRIPLESLMQCHPELRALLAITSLSSTADTSATSHPSNPTSSSHAPSSPTHHHTSTSRSALPITSNTALNTLQASSATLNSSSTGSLATSTASSAPTTSTAQHTAVPRTLESFPNPKRMLWHEHNARKHDSRFGKEVITRDENGDLVSKERYREIETGIRLHTQEVVARIRASLEPEEKDTVINFTYLKNQEIEELMGLIRRLEALYLELAWCALHYKIFRWILLRLKSETDDIAKRKKKEQQQSTTKGKKRKIDDIPGKASLSKASLSKASSSKASRMETISEARGETEDVFNDAFDSDEDSAQPKKKKVKPLTPVQKLNDLMQTTAPATDENRNAPQTARQGTPISNHAEDFSDVEMEASLKVDGAPQKTIQIPARAVSAVPDAKSISAVANSSSKRMLIPGRAPSSTNSTSVSTVNTTSALPVKKGLVNMRTKDMNARLAFTADSLRMSLSSTYSNLKESESVLAAIDVIETAQSCGYGANGEGDAGFVVWLEGLEQLKEEAITDEDELAEGFGHKAVGSWKYDEALKNIDTWDTTENAYKAISALLRLWGMAPSEEQLHITTADSHHIGRVCERIQTAFKITKTSGQHQAAEGSASTQDGLSTKKPRARVSKELDQGIVSEKALKTLSKRSAADFLDKANIKHSKRAKKEDLIDMLINAHSNGMIKITAEQVRLARSKVENDKQ